MKLTFNKYLISTLFLVYFLFFGSVSLASAATYYVDSSRTTSGDGSEANPWKNWSNINWTTITNSLASESVTIFFSSRDIWSSSGSYTISSSGSSSYSLSLIGDAKYNLIDEGSASWQNEIDANNRAKLTQTGGSGIAMGNSMSYITIKGFWVYQPVWGCINLGSANPTTNIHHVTVENNVCESPANNHGIWFGYAETGCSDIIVRNNTISGTPLECIYMGHYSYLPSTITGVVIEGNTCIDTGLSGEGDIDIKPGVYGAIVRNNTVYRTVGQDNGGNSGVVVAADAVEIYGNTFYRNDQKADNDWGFGIYLNADGDGTTGKNISSALIYNNLIYANDRSGIKIGATKTGYTISGVRVYNNTISGNGTYGVQFTASGTTIGVNDFKNNIIVNNTGYDLYVTNGVTLSSVDNNLYYRASGNSWWYQGLEKTWLEWQGLGFDANGLNTDPLLNADYTLQSLSPAQNKGASIAGYFNTDKEGTSRPQGSAWDIGAYEYAPGATPPTCTSFTYSDWGTCQSSNTQTRTVATSFPANCTGGSPTLTQSCTYTTSSSSHKKKKKSSSSKYSIKTSPSKVKPNQVIIESGKKFSKNSTVRLYFFGAKTVMITLKTDVKGNFSLAYKIPFNKPKGTYKWYALDIAKNKKSKTVSYTVR